MTNCNCKCNKLINRGYNQVVFFVNSGNKTQGKKGVFVFGRGGKFTGLLIKMRRKKEKWNKEF